MTLFGKLAYQEDGRLMSQSNHLIWVWIPVSFINQRWEEVRQQSKEAIKGRTLIETTHPGQAP